MCLWGNIQLRLLSGIFLKTHFTWCRKNSRRERQNESRLRSVAKPAWQQGGGEHCAAAAAGGPTTARGGTRSGQPAFVRTSAETRSQRQQKVWQGGERQRVISTRKRGNCWLQKYRNAIQRNISTSTAQHRTSCDRYSGIVTCTPNIYITVVRRWEKG